jgi:hypothetical protein
MNAESPRADVELSKAREMLAEAMADRVTWGDGTEYINVEDAARILADRLAAVQAEADAARREERMRAEDHANAWREVASLVERAEGAEAEAEELRAERDDLRARLLAVETQVAEWERDDEESLNRFGQHLMGGSVLSCAEHLRAALASPTTAVTATEPGCTCGGIAACEQCQSRDAALASPSTHTQREHVDTDPRCSRHVPPTTPDEQARFDEGRGRICPACERDYDDAQISRGMRDDPEEPTHTQQDTETAAQALREAADAAEAQCWCPIGVPVDERCESITDDAAEWLRARADSLDTGAGS